MASSSTDSLPRFPRLTKKAKMEQMFEEVFRSKNQDKGMSYRDLALRESNVARNMIETRSRLPIAPYPRGIARDEKTKMHQYQLEALGGMLQLKSDFRGGILADEMGLGKTIVVIAYIVKTRLPRSPYTTWESKPTRTALLVVPAGLVINWQNEINKWVTTDLRVVYGHPSAVGGKKASALTKEEVRNADLVVVSRDALRAEYRQWTKEDVPKDEPVEDIDVDDTEASERVLVGTDCEFTDLILDEVQCIANYDTQLARAVRSVYRLRSWGMTGTLVRNRIDDIHSYFAFLRVPYWEDLDVFRELFNTKFGVADEVAEQLTRLHYVLALWTIRRKKLDIFPNFPQLSSSAVYTVYTELDLATLIALTELGEDLLRYCTSVVDAVLGDTLDTRSIMMRLRLVSIHVGLVVDHDFYDTSEQRREKSRVMWEKRMAEFRDKDNDEYQVRTSHRLNKVVELLRDYHTKENRSDSRTIIFAPWVRALDLMELRLMEEPGYNTNNVFRVDGRNTPDIVTRYEVLRNFEKSPAGSVLLASIACLKEGHNIAYASHVIFLAVTWSPVNEAQALARAWRMPQKHTVTVHVMRSNTWIDYYVHSLRKQKGMCEDYAVDGKGVPDVPPKPRPARGIQSGAMWDMFDEIHVDKDNETLRNLKELVNRDRLTRFDGAMDFNLGTGPYSKLTQQKIREQEKNEGLEDMEDV